MIRKCALPMLALLAATQALGQTDRDDFQIRSYEVPQEHQYSLESVLGEAVSLALGLGEERRSAGVSSTGQGQLLVTAPPHIQEDVARFLRDFTPSPIPSLITDFWVVKAVRGNGGNYGTELEAIATVLDSIQSSQGDMQFQLLEHVQARSLADGQRVAMNGNRIVHDLRFIQGKITGTFGLQYQDSSLRTNIALDPGEFVVLGSASVAGDSPDPMASELLFYILRVQTD